MATQLGSIKRVRRFPGFVVDGFNYQSPDVVAYFLTHFHADHTVGLHAGFKGPAPIYCSAVTAALVTNVMGVKPSLVRAVPLNDTVQVQTADGAVAFVTFLDANHCPGSATIHFRRRRGADEEDASLKEEKKKGVDVDASSSALSGDVVALHTGDFRAARCVREDPKLHALIRDHGPIGELYLDTTYCDPRWRFPDRKRACAAMAEIARRELLREPRTLFLVGSYSIGKERAVKAVANAVRSRVGVGWHRARTLKLTGWWDENLFLCEDDERAVADAAERAATSASGGAASPATPAPPFRVRVSPMGGGPPHENMARLLRESRDPNTGEPYFKAAVSFRPTGWSYRGSKATRRGDGDGDGDAKTTTTNSVGAVPSDDAFSSDDEHERAGAASASLYAPWVENDGATRVYAVPYSEHSSFDELLAFVRRVKPVRVTPTVNAQTDAEREKILRHFQHLTDASRDRNRLEHYFSSNAAAAFSFSRGFSKGKGEARDERFEAPSSSARSADEDGAGLSGADPETLAALRSMLTPAELRQQVALLEEAARAKAGRVKRETGYGEMTNDPSATPFPLGCVALVRGGGGGFGGGGAKYAQFRDKAHIESRLRALGATVVHRVSPKVTHVVVPAGGEALAEERRRHGQADKKVAAGAGGAPASKPGYEAKPEPAEATAEIEPERDANADATRVEVVTEGWVMRHWRAHQNGTAKRHDPETVRAHEAETRLSRRIADDARRAAKRKTREALENGEDVRPGRERAMSRAVLDRVARAGTQRLFLVRRLDLARGDGAGRPRSDGGDGATKETTQTRKWHARFAVFGTTGNVYECDVRDIPSCDCPDFAGGRRGGPGTPGSRVCKHLLWLYMRVLGVPRDDPLLCQTALTQKELARLLAAPSAAQRASLAARAAREAYARANDRHEDLDLSLHPPVPVISRKNPNEETCPVCFDDVVDAADAAAGMDPTCASKVWWCVNGCGSNVHASCMRRWIEKTDAVSSGDGFGGFGATCPLCRAGWTDQEPGGGAAEPETRSVPFGVAANENDASPSPSPSGARYVNLARFQAGTASGRDLEQYNDFARRAIEKRQREERRRSGEGVE